MRSIVLTLLIFPLISFAGSEQSLKEIVEKTIASNPEVQAKYHVFQSALDEQKAAKGALYPKADITSTLRRQESFTPNVGNTAVPERQTQLIIKQLLYDGFASSGEVKRLDHAAKVRYYEMLSTIQNTALGVVTAYFDVERYRILVKYAEDNFVAHKQLFDRIQDRVQAGISRRVDLEQANGRLALAEANLLTETTNLHDVTARYQRLVGELPPDKFTEKDFYKQGVEPNVQDSLKVAYQHNPDLLSTIENIVATKQEVENKRAKYSPRLDLQATKNLDVNSEASNSLSNADTIALILSFNVFNGFTDKYTIKQTAEKLNTSEDLRDKACVDTRQTLIIAYNDISRLDEQLLYRDQHQLSIEKARQAYRKQFDIGQRTLLDLLDTENEYFQARRTYSFTEYDLYTAYARTYAAQGDLLTRMGVIRSDLPEMTRADYLDDEAKVCQTTAPVMLRPDKDALVAEAKPLSDTLVSLARGGNLNGGAATAKKPEVPEAQPQEAKPSDAEILSSRVSEWVNAWQAKNYDAYIAMYSDSFTPEKNLSRSAWAEQRRQRLAKPDEISISLKDINIAIDGKKATADFVQVYKSNIHSDTVNKRLEFELKNEVWVITKEIILK